jgi:MFS family permease
VAGALAGAVLISLRRRAQLQVPALAVLAVALLVEAGAMAVFLDAHGVTALYLARIVQGLDSGAAVGLVGAYLLDLQRPDGSRLGSLVNSAAATGGLGLGTVVSGVLLQYGPHPTRLVFGILTALFVLLGLATAVLPETVNRQPGARAALRPRVAVPTAARRAFARAVPTMTSTWMLGGLMFSVGGSLLGVVFGQDNHAVVGLVLGLFAGAAAVNSVLLRNRPPEEMERIGTALLFVGTTLFVIALDATSLGIFVVGAALAGAGFGPGFLGAYRTVSQLAAPHERAALISAIFVASYVAFSVPALIAGVLITENGLRSTSLVYGGFVAVVAAGTALYQNVTAHRLARA